MADSVSPWFAVAAASAAAVVAVLVSRRAKKAAFKLAYHVYADTPVGHLLHRTLFMSSVAAAKGALNGHSKTLFTPFYGFSVLPVAIAEDNYAYLLVDEATRDAALVDPADPAVCLRAAEIAGVRLTHVLTTHKHHDHAGGNDAIKQAVPDIVIVGGRNDGVRGATLEVAEGDTIEIGANTVVKVLDTPGHTRGHVVYAAHPAPAGQASAGTVSDGVLAAANATRWPDQGIHSAAGPIDPVAERSVAAFTGDLLFSAGCGRFFEGSAEDFYEALVRKLGAFADNTLFFAGHEYTASNLEFARWADPKNPAVTAKSEWVARRRETNGSTMPFSLAEERLVNPFMRVHELSATIDGGRLADGPSPAVATMGRLRELKNQGAHKK